MVYQNLAGSHKVSAQNIFCVYFNDMHGKKSKLLPKKAKINKLKNARNKVARLTLKWPNGRLSWNWGLNTSKFDWFSLKNQKLIGRKNFQAISGKPGKMAGFFGLMDRKSGPIQKISMQNFSNL